MTNPGLKKTCSLVFILVLISSGLFSQPSFNPDSLQMVVDSDARKEDKCDALKDLAQGYITTDPDRANQFIDQLILTARHAGYDKALSDGYQLKCNYYLQRGSYDSTVIYSDSGIQICIEMQDQLKEAELNILKGKALYYDKGPRFGIEPYQASLNLYENVGDSLGMSLALNAMGVMFKKLSQYDSALSCYLKMVTISEKKGYEKMLGMAYLNMGILYSDLKEFDNARYFLEKSIPINEKFRPDGVPIAQMNIGLVYFARKEYDSALVEMRMALEEMTPSNSSKDLADLYNNIGSVYYNSINLDSAYKYFDAAKDIFEQLGNDYSYGQSINNLALIFIDRGNYKKGFSMLDSCLSFAMETSNIDLEALVFSNKYYAYYKLGEYKKALDNYLIYDSLQKVIYNLDKDKLKTDMEMKYQTQKKQAQILILERDNLIKTKRSNIYLFSGLGIIALITFAFLYFRQRAVKDRIIAQQRIRQLEEEKKLLAAKSLVEGQEEERKRIAGELHDGLGVLLSTTKMQFTTLRDKHPENQDLVEKAIKLLEQASGDVRRISHNMMPGLLTKLGLFEAVADLFEKLSETEGLIVRADIPEDAERLPENKEIMVYRVIQELVNNTLKHAKARNIEIQIQMLPGFMDIMYSDDGKGFNVEEKVESKSIGLSSIQSRINFLNGKVHVFSEPGKGVQYKFEIPI